jgi:hypothetical protein
MAKKSVGEFEKFDSTMRQLINVSHDELKAKLDAEKKLKKPNKSTKRKSKRAD